jgi:hypothetical protein
MSERNEQKTRFLPRPSTGRDWKCIFVVCGYTYNHRSIPVQLFSLCRDNLHLYVRINILY